MHIFQIRLLLTVFMLAMAGYSSAQDHESHGFMCSYYGEEIDPEILTSAPSADARDVIQKILSVVGLKPNFEIRAANVPNAAAVIIKNQRVILYNPKFISAINNASGSNWAGISIIAHEIGHHLNGHTLTSGGSRPDIELEADEFSGFVLNKMGASLTDAQAAMAVAASQKASHTHPAKRDRLVAIAAGWQNASGQIARTGTVKKTDPKITKPVMVKIPERAPTSVLDDKYIAFDVQFYADRSTPYYITVRGNLVTIDNNELYIIGRLADSNKRGYKLMIHDKNYNYLYVGNSGQIVNGSGKKVGVIRTH